MVGEAVTTGTAGVAFGCESAVSTRLQTSTTFGNTGSVVARVGCTGPRSSIGTAAAGATVDGADAGEAAPFSGRPFDARDAGCTVAGAPTGATNPLGVLMLAPGAEAAAGTSTGATTGTPGTAATTGAAAEMLVGATTSATGIDTATGATADVTAAVGVGGSAATGGAPTGTGWTLAGAVPSAPGAAWAAGTTTVGTGAAATALGATVDCSLLSSLRAAVALTDVTVLAVPFVTPGCASSVEEVRAVRGASCIRWLWLETAVAGWPLATVDTFALVLTFVSRSLRSFVVTCPFVPAAWVLATAGALLVAGIP